MRLPPWRGILSEIDQLGIKEREPLWATCSFSLFDCICFSREIACRDLPIERDAVARARGKMLEEEKRSCSGLTTSLMLSDVATAQAIEHSPSPQSQLGRISQLGCMSTAEAWVPEDEFSPMRANYFGLFARMKSARKSQGSGGLRAQQQGPVRREG